jgi:hypothetical protein
MNRQPITELAAATIFFILGLLFVTGLKTGVMPAYADPPSTSYYPFNGAAGGAVSSGTSVTLSRLGNTSSYNLTLSSGTYSANLSLSDAGGREGDVYLISVSYPGQAGAALNVFDSGTGGTLLTSSSSSGIAGSTTLEFVNVTGTAWVHFPKGAILTKDLGAGVQTALKGGLNTGTGLVTGSGVAAAAAAGQPILGSSNVIYASEGVPQLGIAGAALNSNLNTGGGTDDTVALQRELNAIKGMGGGTLVIERPALISAVTVTSTSPASLMVPSHTMVKFLPGAGLFLSASSNCTAMSNADITGSAPWIDSDIWLQGGQINCNGSNQSLRELNSSYNGFCMGLFFSGISNLHLDDVEVRNPVGFGFLIANYQDAFASRCTLWVDTYIGNSVVDGFHLWSGSHFRSYEFWDHNGGGNAIAVNTNEGIANYVASPGAFAIYRYPQLSSTGSVIDADFEDNFLDNDYGAPYIYGLTGTGNGTALADQITVRNSYGSVNGPNFQNISSVSLGTITVDGWRVSGSGNSIVLSGSNVRVNNVAPGVSVSVTSTNATGDEFPIVATPQTIYLTATTTTSGTYTLANPSPLFDGEQLNWRLKEDDTGGWATALGSKFRVTGSPLVFGTSAHTDTILTAQYDVADDEWDVVRFLTGINAFGPYLLNANFLAYYKGASLADSSSNGYTLTQSGTVPIISGSGFEFTGTNADYLSSPALGSAINSSATNGITLTAWVNFNSTATRQTVFQTNGGGVSLQLNTSGHILGLRERRR